MTQPSDPDAVFGGSVPELYDRLLVPLIFEHYAEDLMHRARACSPDSVLEVAAGSGVLTRALASGLDPKVAVTASDLNPPMLDRARSVGTKRPVTWQVADVMELPFEDASFDVVLCQFGVMFFPDKVAAYTEVARVLRPGGSFVFNVWDDIANNEFADEVTKAVGTLWPSDPPLFLVRTPHGYYEEAQIQSDVAGAGFEAPAAFEALEARSRAVSANVPAIAYCQGTPLRNEIEARGPGRLVEVTQLAAAAVGARFGVDDLDSKIRGFVVTAHKPVKESV